MNILKRIVFRVGASSLLVLASTQLHAQTPAAPDGTKLGDWINLDNRLSYSKLQKDLAGGQSGGGAVSVPGAVTTPTAAPQEASAPKIVGPKPRPAVTTALYGMTSKEGDQFRGLLQWGDRVYAVRVGGYVKQWRVKKISERGTLLVDAHGREMFAPLDADGGEAATPVPPPQRPVAGFVQPSGMTTYLPQAVAPIAGGQVPGAPVSFPR